MAFFPEKNNKENNPPQEEYVDAINQNLLNLARLFDYDYIEDSALREQLFMATGSSIVEFITKLVFMVKMKGDVRMSGILNDIEKTIKGKKELNDKFNSLMKGLDIKGL